MHMLLVLAIALLTAAVVALAFFWLFRSDKLRRAAYAEKHAKFYRWDDYAQQPGVNGRRNGTLITQRNL